MPDLATRFEQNPIFSPVDVPPSIPDLMVRCVLNPGVFRRDGKTCLLLRVAEDAEDSDTVVRTPVLAPNAPNGIAVLEFERADPDLDLSDPRFIVHRGETYLSTMSHLRLATSTDGVQFEVAPKPLLLGEGAHESFGIEDCRVTEIEGRFYLTYSAVSANGVGIGMVSTEDWTEFTRHGIVLPPHNKDCAPFPERIQGSYWTLHRPFDALIGGRNIWISRSPDLLHWGEHVCLARKRPDHWDCERIGAGAAPIRTDEGWLEIYHGADHDSRYCLGAMLLGPDDPTRVLARSEHPIMEPSAPYEKEGFFGNVVFCNGHIVDGDRITIYYGASDQVVCGATMLVSEILASLRR